MFKYLLFLPLVFILSGCTIKSTPSILDGTVANQNSAWTYDSCTNFSYIAESNDARYGKIFVEDINLDMTCKWNGLARGFFVTLFMDTIKARTYKLIERLDFENIEVSTYLVDDTFYINIVNQYTVSEDILMIDYNGIYTTELVKKYNPNYVNAYLQKPRLDVEYSKSLVRMNFFYSYFSRMRESFGAY
jgi:hypothetical protein